MMMTLSAISDAELVLLTLALKSGLRIRPKDQIDDAMVAVTVNQMLRAVVAEALERRELDVQKYVASVVAKALEVLPPEV